MQKIKQGRKKMVRVDVVKEAKNSLVRSCWLLAGDFPMNPPSQINPVFVFLDFFY